MGDNLSLGYIKLIEKVEGIKTKDKKDNSESFEAPSAYIFFYKHLCTNFLFNGL